MFQFSAFRVPVTIDPWFLLGLFFISQWSGGGRVGLIAAVALGVLTLIHELGHALVARRAGCNVSIRLNLFVGWASYSAARPLSRAQKIRISLAGPLTQLATGLLALSVVHTLFHQPGSNRQLWADMWFGLSWAGIAIAVLNLLPLWPLDGSHVVQQVLSKWFDDRKALRATLMISVAGLGVVLAIGLAGRNHSIAALEHERQRAIDGLYALTDTSLVSALWGQFRALPLYFLELPWFLLLFSGLATMQTLSAIKRQDRQVQDLQEMASGRGGPTLLRPMTPTTDPTAAAAELEGWRTGHMPAMPKGNDPSPWLRAHVARTTGHVQGARAALMKVTADGGRWSLPDPVPAGTRELIDLLPSPPPVGDRARSLALLRVLAAYGDPKTLLDYANEVYKRFSEPEALYRAAAGLAQRGLPDDAMAWLRRAALERPDHTRIASDPAFVPLHSRLDFQQVLARTRGALN